MGSHDKEPRIPGGARHLSILPFEALIAGLAIISGGLALIHYGGVGADAISALLPDWMNTTFSCIYLLSGLALLIGLLWPRRDLEAFGLIVVATSVIVRSFLIYAAAGLTSLVLTSYIFNAMIVAACAARVRTISRGEVLVVMKGEGGSGDSL